MKSVYSTRKDARAMTDERLEEMARTAAVRLAQEMNEDLDQYEGSGGKNLRFFKGAAISLEDARQVATYVGLLAVASLRCT